MRCLSKSPCLFKLLKKTQPNQTLKKESNQFWTEAKFEMVLDKVMSL